MSAEQPQSLTYCYSCQPKTARAAAFVARARGVMDSRKTLMRIDVHFVELSDASLVHSSAVAPRALFLAIMAHLIHASLCTPVVSLVEIEVSVTLCQLQNA
jgi:hypothetical protein